MPDKEFLESYPLYQTFEIDLPDDITEISMPSINLYCKNCESIQTFIMADRRDMFGKIINDHPKGVPASVTDPNVIYVRNKAYSSSGAILNVTYNCMGCGNFTYHYAIKLGEDSDLIMKIGQYPPLSISGNKNLKRMMGKHEDIYNKGLICESQAYGIGAYAYYRRIVEEVIDELLMDLTTLIEKENKEEYKKALAEFKDSYVAKNKIKLVKDLLPNSLQRNDMNPLQTLHSVLSQGVHSLDDEECLERAKYIHGILTYLVRELIEHREDDKVFTDSIKKLLEKGS